MNGPHLSKGNIVGVRVRAGFFGRPVVQISRQALRMTLRDGQVWEVPHGEFAYLDARAIDMPELTVFLHEQGKGIGA